MESFAGHTFHSATWDHDYDLTGKRVAVVGTGASAIQFVPEIAAVARSVTLFQRSSNYVAPKPDGEFSPRAQQLFARIPAGRWGTPADLQGAFVFLASDAAAYVTGAIVPVDGGWLVR